MTNTWLDFTRHLEINHLPSPLLDNAVYILSGKQQLTVQGQDACQFLQGQVSCDVTQVSTEKSLIGSHNTVKGRVTSSFRLYQDKDNSYQLCMNASIIEHALTALKKYIVFSKANIDINKQTISLGLHGLKARDNLNNLFNKLPSKPMAQVVTENGAIIICTDTDLPAYELHLQEAHAIELWPKISASLPLLDESQQRLIEHRNGLGFIDKQTVDIFLAQMLNYEEVSAISFNKGCYTGQEIVARTKYLGKLKRHMYHCRGKSSANLEPCDYVSLEPHIKRHLGNIVSAVAIAPGYWDLLVVLTDEAAQQSEFYINDQLFSDVEMISLPYSMANNT